MLRMSSVTIKYSCQTTSKTRETFINWTCGRMAHIFSSATFKSEAVLGFGWRFHSLVRRSPEHDISIPFKLESYLVAIVPFQAFAGSSGGGKRHVQCAPCNLPLHLAAVNCTIQWILGAEINKQLQLLFTTTLTLILRHSYVTVV